LYLNSHYPLLKVPDTSMPRNTFDTKSTIPFYYFTWYHLFPIIHHVWCTYDLLSFVRISFAESMSWINFDFWGMFYFGRTKLYNVVHTRQSCKRT